MIFACPPSTPRAVSSSHTCGLVVRLARRKNHGLRAAAALVPKGITGGNRSRMGPAGQWRSLTRGWIAWGLPPTSLHFHFADLNDGLDVRVVGNISHDLRSVRAKRGL